MSDGKRIDAILDHTNARIHLRTEEVSLTDGDMCIFRERPTLMSGSDRLTDPAMILRAFDQGAVRMEVLWNEMLISCAHGRDIFPVWVSLQRDFLDIVERTQIRMNLGLSPTSLAMPTLMDELLKGTFARSG